MKAKNVFVNLLRVFSLPDPNGKLSADKITPLKWCVKVLYL